MTLMALVMGLVLPRRLPAHRASYPALIASVFALARRHAASRPPGACLESCSALKIERRPRGASRARSLLHFLQRTYA
ncbi:hypothetical protein [Pseudomonas japonica]|uniref:hypothetical protein n=1 Tax=Pseudomonas japonica TaxID=256466 RepID=UPI001132732B|nr:hypothetical protein [Pseudomonas japonica]